MNKHKIYVNHIPASFDVDALERLFSTHGKITQVNYPVDKKTNKPKGYAFVTFEESSSVQSALQKHNEVVEDGTLIVEIANEKPPKKDKQKNRKPKLKAKPNKEKESK